MNEEALIPIPLIFTAQVPSKQAFNFTPAARPISRSAEPKFTQAEDGKMDRNSLTDTTGDIRSTTDDASAVVIEGWLEKKGNWTSVWSNRYVKVLQSGVLIRFVEEPLGPTAVRGRYSLVDATVERLDSTSDGKCPFVVRTVDKGEKISNWRTSNEQEAVEWMQAITDCAAEATALNEVVKAAKAAQEAEVMAAQEAAKALEQPEGTTEQPVGTTEQPAAKAAERPVVPGLATLKSVPRIITPSSETGETPRTAAAVRVAMEKAFGSELESLHTQCQSSRAQLDAAEAALGEHEAALIAVGTERTVKMESLQAKLGTIRGQSVASDSFAAALTALQQEATGVLATATNHHRSVGSVRNRLDEERSEVQTRMEQIQERIGTLVARAVTLDSKAESDTAALQAAVEAGIRDFAATSMLLKFMTEQRGVLAERLVAVEQEHALGTRLLRTKAKLAETATAEANALMEELATLGKTGDGLAERETVISSAKAAAKEAARVSQESLVAAEHRLLELEQVYASYLKTGEAHGGEAVETEKARVEDAARQLREQQVAAAAAVEAAGEGQSSELRKVQAEKAASKAVHERKATHAQQKQDHVRELEAAALEQSLAAAGHAECVRVLAAEAEDLAKREVVLQQSKAAAEVDVQTKTTALSQLKLEFEQAAAERKLKIASERQVLAQQEANAARLQAAISAHSATPSESGPEGLLTSLLNTADVLARERCVALKATMSQVEGELADVETRARAQEAYLKAEVGAATEALATQRVTHTQLEKHEQEVIQANAAVVS